MWLPAFPAAGYPSWALAREGPPRDWAPSSGTNPRKRARSGVASHRGPPPGGWRDLPTLSNVCQKTASHFLLESNGLNSNCGQTDRTTISCQKLYLRFFGCQDPQSLGTHPGLVPRRDHPGTGPWQPVRSRGRIQCGHLGGDPSQVRGTNADSLGPSATAG